MKRIVLLVSVIISALMFSCTDNVHDDIINNGGNVNNPVVGINQSGQNAEGLKYSFNNVVVNPKIVSLTNENAKLLSNQNEIAGGVYKLEISDNAASINLAAGNIIYLLSGEDAHLRIIKNVNQTAANTFKLDTEQAYLGDLFESGSLEFSVDVQKAENAIKKNSMVLRSTDYDQTFTYDILNYIKEYNAHGMVFNPNTSVKTYFNVKLGFNNRSKIVPSEFIFSYEIKPEFNPYLNFSQSLNKEVSIDMIDYVPSDLMELLKKIEIDIEIPAGALGNIPAKIGIDQIQFPANIIANVSNVSDLAYHVDGSLKVGYAYYNNVPNMKSHFIYENTMTADETLDININGEVITDINLVIVPKISIINDGILTASGNITYGFETITSTGISSTNKAIAGSKGTFKSSATFDIYSLGIRIFSTELFKENKDIWNVGEFNTNISFSDLKLKKPTKTPCGLLSYNYDITVGYNYPILGKKVPGTLTMTYDVYDDKNKLLRSGEKSVFTPSDLTANSFRFDLCIPFKADAWAWSGGFMRPLSYIKNVVVTDGYGNAGTIADFSVGSPYNNSFWR